MLLTDVAKRSEIVKSVREDLTKLTHILQEHTDVKEAVDEVMLMRKYTDDRMRNLLLEKGIIKMPTLSDIQLLCAANGLELDATKLRYLGLVDDSGNYFLEYRYAVPVKNYSGIVLALVCWYPDNRKYITTGTLGFTSSATFFNADSYKKAFDENGKSTVFVVEGIYDSLSIESLGYAAFGNQGLDMSPVKKEILSRFDKVIFIPDNDRPGMKSNKYTCIKSNHLWDIPNGHMIKLCGHIKDMDDLIKTYHFEDLDFLKSVDRYLKFEV